MPPKPAADSPREPQHPLCAPFPPFTVFSDFSVIFSPYFGLDAAGLEIVCFPVLPAAIVVYALRCSPACRTRRAHTARRPHAPRVGRLPPSLSAAAAPRRRRLRPAPPAPLVEGGAAQDRGGPVAAAIGRPTPPLSAAGAWAAAALGRGEPRGRERGRLRPYLSALPEPLTSFELETGPFPSRLGLPRTRPGTEVSAAGGPGARRPFSGARSFPRATAERRRDRTDSGGAGRGAPAAGGAGAVRGAGGAGRRAAALQPCRRSGPAATRALGAGPARGPAAPCSLPPGVKAIRAAVFVCELRPAACRLIAAPRAFKKIARSPWGNMPVGLWADRASGLRSSGDKRLSAWRGS